MHTSKFNTAALTVSSSLHSHVMHMAILFLFVVALSACGGGGGGSDGGGNSSPDNSNTGSEPVESNDNGADSANSEFAPLEVHLGFENEASATRINFPLFILATAANWLSFDEQFRQLGALVDLWDRAQSGEIQLPETSNIPLLGADISLFTRDVRIVRTDWATMGEKCGYGSGGQPNNGCAYINDLPECSIYVPQPEIYKNGDENAFHALLGHEMWHCLVGDFH